jgi:hypothetical protein
MSGKGDKRVKTSDPAKYSSGWDRIWGTKKGPAPEGEGPSDPEGSPGEQIDHEALLRMVEVLDAQAVPLTGRYLVDPDGTIHGPS